MTKMGIRCSVMNLRIDVTPEPLPPIAEEERTSSEIQEAEVMKLDNILQKMKKQSRESMLLNRQRSNWKRN